MDKLSAVSRAMPSARATHASHRARILGLGLSVGIAIAVSACDRPSPRAVAKALTGEGEAGLSCYSSAEDYVAYQDVAAALRDGTLTANECDSVVMPHVRASNDAALERVKQRAVRAAIATEARRAETTKIGSVHEGAGRQASPNLSSSGADNGRS